MKKLFYLSVLALLPLASADAQPPADGPQPPEPSTITPTEKYVTKNVVGWQVRVNPALVDQKKLYTKTLHELRLQLHRIVRRLPAAAVKKMRDIPIWVEATAKHPLCMCYHEIGTGWLAENGLNPDKAGAVDVGDAQNFIDWTHVQPWMVLHELAHGYHDRLPQRFENPEVKKAYERAIAANKYERIQRYNGKMEKAYAATNPMEYFAETTEAFFGRNDFYPYLRPELRQHDPHGYTMLKRVWGHSDVDNYLWRIPSLPATTPWELAELGKVPRFKWLDEDQPVRSLVYRGEPYGGKRSRVFAYYATPGTLKGDTRDDICLPAIVLVHGGGGTAFKEWAQQWAERGYAAIAMDLAGRGADRKPLPGGGPDQNDQVKFGQIDEPVTEQWTYHAVANVIRAHSLVRSFPEVDEERTAVTGISWGGYLTCIVAGLDRRFDAAVPVYGCGFLDESSTWLPRFEKMTEPQRQRWVELWDPSRYVGAASVPMFFINGTNDGAYWLDSYDKTYRLYKNGHRNLRITVNMPHSHPAGWAPKEIALFVDHHLRGTPPLPLIKTPEIVDEQVRAQVDARTELNKAELHFTTDTGAIHRRTWQTTAAKIDGHTITAAAPPQETTVWFVTLSDNRDAIVSSEVIFVPKKKE